MHGTLRVARDTGYDRAMVRAYHLILTCYGFWLPNDPRGSWSEFVRSFELYRVGGSATKVQTKASLAHRPHDHARRLEAKKVLSRPPVVFTGEQSRSATQGFGDYIGKNQRTVFACAVMPDHVHFVVQRCDRPIETLAEQLKARATMFMNQAGLHPFADRPLPNGRPPTPWARKCWSVFMDSDASIARAIAYVEQNPVKAGHRPQRYTWVKTFKG